MIVSLTSNNLVGIANIIRSNQTSDPHPLPRTALSAVLPSQFRELHPCSCSGQKLGVINDFSYFFFSQPTSKVSANPESCNPSAVSSKTQVVTTSLLATSEWMPRSLQWLRITYITCLTPNTQFPSSSPAFPLGLCLLLVPHPHPVLSTPTSGLFSNMPRCTGCSFCLESSSPRVSWFNLSLLSGLCANFPFSHHPLSSCIPFPLLPTLWAPFSYATYASQTYFIRPWYISNKGSRRSGIFYFSHFLLNPSTQWLVNDYWI